MSVKLSDVNEMSEAEFTATLGFAFENSPWVAARAAAARPFADLEALQRAMLAALTAATPEERAALIRAHPELAGKAAIAGELTAASRSEQAGAGLDRLTPGEFARFRELNAAYGARFGFPFVICARLADQAAILEAMARRLENSRQAEIDEAITQIGLIGRLRIEGAVAL